MPAPKASRSTDSAFSSECLHQCRTSTRQDELPCKYTRHGRGSSGLGSSSLQMSVCLHRVPVRTFEIKVSMICQLKVNSLEGLIGKGKLCRTEVSERVLGSRRANDQVDQLRIAVTYHVPIAHFFPRRRMALEWFQKSHIFVRAIMLV